jgi:hypothetical protein
MGMQGTRNGKDVVLDERQVLGGVGVGGVLNNKLDARFVGRQDEIFSRMGAGGVLDNKDTVLDKG